MDQEKIEQLIEKKVEQKTKELEEKVDELQEENEKLRQQREQPDAEQEDETVSRRDFLKKAGLGAMGLGAMAMSPASAFDIKDTNLNVQTGSDAGSLSQAMNIDSNGNVSIPNGNLSLGSGYAIEDGGGNDRFEVLSGNTRINNESGTEAIRLDDNYFAHYAYSGVPWRIYDQQMGGTAFQYESDNSSGTLRAPNAGFRVEDFASSMNSGEGLDLNYFPSGPLGRIRSFDESNSNFLDLTLMGSEITLDARGGLVDMSDSGADLRIATDRGIEDGGGTLRASFDSTKTQIFNDNQDVILWGQSGTETQIKAPDSSTPIAFRDGSNNHDLAKITTGNPGTFEITNADLSVPDSNWINFGVAGSNLDFQHDNDSGNDRVTWEVSKDGSSTWYAKHDYDSEYLSFESAGSANFLEITGGVDLRLDTGQSIEDGSGTNRIEVNSGHTRINHENGVAAFDADANQGGGYIYKSGADGSTNRLLYDITGGFTAIEYTNSSGSTGTLNLKNANLGINTSSPNTKFNIYDAADYNSTDLSNKRNIVLEGFGNDDGGGIIWHSTAGKDAARIVTESHGSYNRQDMVFYTNNSSDYSSAATEAMRLDRGGDMHLKHSSSNRYIWFNDSSDSKWQGVLFGDSSDNSRGRVQYDHSSDNLRLYNAGNILRVQAAGDVEIPNSGLSVTPGSGNTNPLSVYGDSSRWKFTSNSSSTYNMEFDINDTAAHIYHNSSNRELHLGSNSRSDLKIGSGGGVTLQNGNLNLNDNNITGINDIFNSTGVLSLGTDGSGSGIVQFLDSNLGSRTLYYQEGSGLFVENTDLGMNNNNINNVDDLDANTINGQDASNFNVSVQSPQDVTSNRTTGTQYTNNNNRPRVVTIIADEGGYGNYEVALDVDGVRVAYESHDDGTTTNRRTTISAIVPSGSTYTAVDLGRTSIDKWIEQDF